MWPSAALASLRTKPCHKCGAQCLLLSYWEGWQVSPLAIIGPCRVSHFAVVGQAIFPVSHSAEVGGG